MIPGVWLEMEVMGIYCDLAKQVSDDWFFVRHGKRVYDRSRYQLDYRNPKVREYADSVIDRIVKEYGVGYSLVELSRMARSHVNALEDERPGHVGCLAYDFRVHEVAQSDKACCYGSCYRHVVEHAPDVHLCAAHV